MMAGHTVHPEALREAAAALIAALPRYELHNGRLQRSPAGGVCLLRDVQALLASVAPDPPGTKQTGA